MIETCVATARAARPNSAARLKRSSSANFRCSEIRCTRRRSPEFSTRRSSTKSTPAHAITASAPTAARPACAGSTASGTATMHSVSAIATCGSSSSTVGPVSPSESTIGSTSAADEEAISTAYIAVWPVWNSRASPNAGSTASAPMPIARAAPLRSPRSSRGSRIGTCEPATNITSAKPMSARKENVASLGWRNPAKVGPSSTPAASSPTTTGTRHPWGTASKGPTKPTSTMTASAPKVMELILGRGARVSG